MANYVCIQFKEVEKAAVIEADKVEMRETPGAIDYKILVSRKGQPVGEFNGNQVVGWWLQD